MQLWLNILLGWISFSFIQDYDQLSTTCFEIINSNKQHIISMTSHSPQLHFQNMLLHGLLITFLGMGHRLDIVNSKTAQQLLLPHYVT